MSTQKWSNLIVKITNQSHRRQSTKNGSTDHGAKSLYRVIAAVQNAFRARFLHRNPPIRKGPLLRVL